MSKHLEAFLKEFNKKVASGQSSSFDAIELCVLELYDSWLQDKKANYE